MCIRDSLYYDHAELQDISDYIWLDFSWQTENVVAFEEAETFDFDITEDGYAFASRWGPFAHGPADLITDNSVEGFFASRTATGFGIRSNTLGNSLTDFGYDFSANAFQLGSFDWSALNPGATNLEIDELLVSENGMNLDLSIRELAINVLQFFFASRLTMRHQLSVNSILLCFVFRVVEFRE